MTSAFLLCEDGQRKLGPWDNIEAEFIGGVFSNLISKETQINDVLVSLAKLAVRERGLDKMEIQNTIQRPFAKA